MQNTLPKGRAKQLAKRMQLDTIVVEPEKILITESEIFDLRLHHFEDHLIFLLFQTLNNALKLISGPA